MERSIFEARVAGGHLRFDKVRTSYRKLAGLVARALITRLEGPTWNDPYATNVQDAPRVDPADVAAQLDSLRKLTELYAEEHKLHEALDAEERLTSRAREGGG